MNQSEKRSNRLYQTKKHQELMNRHLLEALSIRDMMSDDMAHRVKPVIDEILQRKHEIEKRARVLGYSGKCRQSIPVCRGNCCRYHFPKHLDAIDFFLSVWGLTPDACQQLLGIFEERSEKSYYCPMLLENGCFFSFDHRPLDCTIAYPCFVQDTYQAFLGTKIKPIHHLKGSLKDMLASIQG